jgi:hypothetical protein
MYAWLTEALGAQNATYVTYGIGTVVVILLAWVLWFWTRRVSGGVFIHGSRSRQPRLAVVDATAIDSHRRIVLVRRDDVEHLVMIGGHNDFVIERDIGKEAPAPAISAPAEKEVSAPAPEMPVAQQEAPAPAPARELRLREKAAVVPPPVPTPPAPEAVMPEPAPESAPPRAAPVRRPEPAASELPGDYAQHDTTAPEQPSAPVTRPAAEPARVAGAFSMLRRKETREETVETEVARPTEPVEFSETVEPVQPRAETAHEPEYEPPVPERAVPFATHPAFQNPVYEAEAELVAEEDQRMPSHSDEARTEPRVDTAISEKPAADASLEDEMQKLLAELTSRK